MNSSNMMGAPININREAILALTRSGGLPTGKLAFTKMVVNPNNASNINNAVSKDCEKKKLLSMQKKLKKKTT